MLTKIVNLSEAYISKFQERLSNYLEELIHELKREIRLDIVYWDNIVINIAMNRT